MCVRAFNPTRAYSPCVWLSRFSPLKPQTKGQPPYHQMVCCCTTIFCCQRLQFSKPPPISSTQCVNGCPSFTNRPWSDPFHRPLQWQTLTTVALLIRGRQAETNSEHNAGFCSPGLSLLSSHSFLMHWGVSGYQKLHRKNTFNSGVAAEYCQEGEAGHWNGWCTSSLQMKGCQAFSIVRFSTSSNEWISIIWYRDHRYQFISVTPDQKVVWFFYTIIISLCLKMVCTTVIRLRLD